MARGKGSGKGKGKAKGALRAAGATKAVDRDVYSDDETEREQKEARMNAAVDVDGVYEYEQPETFEHDSEISEDEAFNSDDEEQFGMFFQQKKKLHKKQEEAEETEEEADDEEEDEGNLLSDLLGTAPAARLSTIATDNGDADDDVFDDEDDEEEDDETVAAKSKNLRSLVDTLVPAKKKKKLEEITDATIMASASRARSDSSDAGELTLATLLGGGGEDDDNSEATATATSSSKVKKQIRELEADAAASGPLSSTIAPVLEERAARKLAYEQKKEQVDLFQPVVRRNRQKETMDFREQIPKMENLTAAGLASKFSAETDLEKDVAALLQAGGLSDRAIAQDEHDELVQKKVSVDEVLTRQKELSKMRALMFYDEQKAKRVKKIKSKLYHKIRNAQDKKQQEKQHAQLRALDPELAKQLDDELAEKRAEERLTLKHTNTSKWVKHQLKRGIHADQGTRNAIADQLRRGDELRRKMQTVHSDDEDDGGDDGYSSGEEEGGPVDAATRLQRRLERQADALVTEIDGDQASAGELKGLAGMKFMQRAVQKQRQKARDEAEKLLREIKGENALLSDGDDASSDDGEATTKKKRKHKKQKTQAVAVTDADKAAVAKALPRGALQTGSVSMDKGLSARAAGTIAVDLGDGATTQATTVDVSQDLTTGATVEIGAKKSRSADKHDATEAAEPTATEENPWLTGAATKNKKKHKKAKKSETQSGGVDVAHAMDALTKSVGKPSQGAHLDIAKSAATAVAGTKRKQAFETAADQPTAAPVDESSKKKNATNKKAKITQAEQDKLTQDELVRRAFAFADEGENELQQEKEAIAGQDTQAKKGAEIAKLVGMVGWGSWAGEGVQKSYRQTQREEMAAKLAAATKQQVLQSRKDSKMERVLINEKKDKRAAKFAVDEVPYPFTSREEYEMAMRNPLGGDWNTPSATNALTKPKVMLRAGQMLDPLRLSKEDKKQAKKELTKKRKAKF